MRLLEPHARGRVLALIFCTLAAPLSGCSNVNQAVANSPVPEDFHLRHPIALANVRQTLDIFLDGGNDRLDDRQRRDVEAFAADFRAHGDGRIRAQLPSGAVDGPIVDATLSAIRRRLAMSGVKGDIEVMSYRITDPSLASPIHLSFSKLQAKLASKCGEWPEDLASASSTNGWENRSYYNFGCSTQQTLAAQIDDPRDLVRPRIEEAGDSEMRRRAIENIRGGNDPGTQWQGLTTSGVPSALGTN